MLRAFSILSLIVLTAPSGGLAVSQQELMQQQMEKAMQEMKKHGMDTSAIKNMPQMNAKTMEAAMGMNKCMEEKVGKDGMKRLSDEGQALNKEVDALCAQGKKDEAEQKMKDYGAKMVASKEYKGMRYCADKYKEVMQSPAYAQMREQMRTTEKATEKKGVCG